MKIDKKDEFFALHPDECEDITELRMSFPENSSLSGPQFAEMIKRLDKTVSLKTFALDGLKLSTEEAVAIVEALKNNRNLEVVYVDNATISNACAVKLAEKLRIFSNLRWISLTDNDIKDSGALALKLTLQQSNYSHLRLAVTKLKTKLNELGLPSDDENINRIIHDTQKAICGERNYEDIHRVCKTIISETPAKGLILNYNKISDEGELLLKSEQSEAFIVESFPQSSEENARQRPRNTGGCSIS